MNKKVINVRCSKCNKLLFQYKSVGNIDIEIKCPRCKSNEHFNSLKIKRIRYA